MSREVTGEASSISTLDDQKVNEQDPKGEKFKTLKREDKAKLTPIGDVEYHVDLQQKLTHKTKLHMKKLRMVTRLVVNNLLVRRIEGT